MRTRIKFCGLTRAEDVRLACGLGVDALGLVFAPRSPRRLALAQSRVLREQMAPLVSVVALFMDNEADEIREVISALQPDLLQFHGGEDEAFCAGFGRRYLKTLAMGGGSDAADLAAARYPSAQGYLLDGHGPGQMGGAGQAFDWSSIPRLDKPCLLAGGLTSANVGEAIAVARPYGVDVSSGIESAPGIKDGEKMRQFIDEVRRADQC